MLKKYFFILLCGLILFGAAPQIVFAQAEKLKIGQECGPGDNNDRCYTGDCEEGDNDKWYCDCDDDNDCSNPAEGYGTRQDERWKCVDGGDATKDNDYCESNFRIKYPHGTTNKASALDFLTDKTLGGDEIKKMTTKPNLKISIPGVEFTDAKVIEDSGEGQYLLIPYLGQFIKAAYRYGIAAAGVFAVVMIINAGFLWTRSGGNAQVITAQKETLEKAIIGLIIAVTSYSLLYLINPNLTKFDSLKVQYVKPDLNLVGEHSPDDGSEPNITPGGTLANCQNYPKNWRGIEQCRKDCLAGLPEEKRSKTSGIADNNSSLGYLDCSSIKGQRALSDISYIGIHEGKVTGGPPWWWLQYVELGPSKAFGTHYFVSRDGVIHQTVDERFVVWHGVRNKSSIGIDLDAGCSSAGGSDASSKSCNYTQAQYDSVKRLINDIMKRTNVKFDDDHILGHCQASTNATKGHVDPRNFDWSKIGLNNANHKSDKGVRCLYTM